MSVQDFLYPAIEPFAVNHLISGQHHIYYEQCGNPQGKPVLFLHGGPGGGCAPMYRQYFNPQKYRMILVDQRGCGRSQPSACIEQNTTADLIADFEEIRRQLGINQWMLFGGSWGSTLALLYAQQYPNIVSELVLRGVFLAQRHETQWLYDQGGASDFFPEYWQDFSISSTNNIQAYYQRLCLSHGRHC